MISSLNFADMLNRRHVFLDLALSKFYGFFTRQKYKWTRRVCDLVNVKTLPSTDLLFFQIIISLIYVDSFTVNRFLDLLQVRRSNRRSRFDSSGGQFRWWFYLHTLGWTDVREGRWSNGGESDRDLTTWTDDGPTRTGRG